MPLAVNRLHSLAVVTEPIRGGQRPKQFCPIFSGKSLLAHTLERLGPMFALDHTVCVLARDHEQFYRPELGDKPTREMTMQEEQYVKL